MWKCFTSCSDLITEGDGETFIHIFTYKNKIILNTNVAFMHWYESKEMLYGSDGEIYVRINEVLIQWSVDTSRS